MRDEFNWQVIAIWFFLILAADLVALCIVALWRYFRNKPLDLLCDLCDRLEKLAKTPDKRYYLCQPDRKSVV